MEKRIEKWESLRLEAQEFNPQEYCVICDDKEYTVGDPIPISNQAILCIDGNPNTGAGADGILQYSEWSDTHGTDAAHNLPDGQPFYVRAFLFDSRTTPPTSHGALNSDCFDSAGNLKEEYRNSNYYVYVYGVKKKGGSLHYYEGATLIVLNHS